ncbi:GTPase-GDP dissociation stimulator vimar [Anthonomus grandis grandis]|uniref:GTPase-GDP dissociation stimulator vimar n=1 Tax=Anthonomus grandis grandis TaxID=2921223 RepID=UPI0021661107|nr:GTPase-GDP dissociation stimulator vimar [Anthonomus grandis grandis]
MANPFDELNAAINSKNELEIIKSSKNVTEKSDSLKINDIKLFKKLFELGLLKANIIGAETIAELCRNDENRKQFTDENIINVLMQFLESDSPELLFTTIRALGNICYENEEASNLIDKVGIESILRLLRDDAKRSNDALTIKVSGLLMNLLSTHDNLPKTALKGGILPVLERLLIKYKEPLEGNSVLLTFLLSILNQLADYLDDKEYVFSESLAKIVSEIFKKSDVPEICVLCLEIFHPLSEKDEIKNILAKEGVCELLYDLIEKYRDKVNDEESRAIMKMACDLIVLVLTGDSCMDILYNDGKGQTYLNMLTWLDSTDSDLLSTGILAVGNFARKDTNCIQMVKNGLAKKLIDILRNFNNSVDINDCKVQHALLSTLKNLAIPKENKQQALKDDIIEVMYPMLKQDRFLVIFKLLGTFRMVIDGQPDAAKDLLSRRDFIERLVYWCYNSDHLGVRGEVPRIFSWLIKNCQSSEPFCNFIAVKDSTKCIVEMISSNHGVMQNESFFALNILAVGLKNEQASLDAFYQSLCDSELGKNLNFVLNKYAEKWDQHTIENCLTLLEHLTHSEKVVTELKNNDIVPLMEKLTANPNSSSSQERIEKLLQLLKQ